MTAISFKAIDKQNITLDAQAQAKAHDFVVTVQVGMTETERKELVRQFTLGNHQSKKAFLKFSEAARNALINCKDIEYANDFLRIMRRSEKTTKYAQIFQKNFIFYCGAFRDASRKINGAQRMGYEIDTSIAPCVWDKENKKFQLVKFDNDIQNLLKKNVRRMFGQEIQDCRFFPPEKSQDKYEIGIKKIHDIIAEWANTGEKWASSPARKEIDQLLVCIQEVWPDCRKIDNKQALLELSTRRNGKAQSATV